MIEFCTMTPVGNGMCACGVCGRPMVIPINVDVNLLYRVCTGPYIPPKGDRSQLPSLATRAGNLARATAEHVRTGRKILAQEQIEARLAICRGCPHFIGDGTENGECSKCGCTLTRKRKFASKIAWAEQGCWDTPPRWGPMLKE